MQQSGQRRQVGHKSRQRSKSVNRITGSHQRLTQAGKSGGRGEEPVLGVAVEGGLAAEAGLLAVGAHVLVRNLCIMN